MLNRRYAAAVTDTPLHRKPTIAISMGEPAGIGPEVIVKALADPEVRALGRFVIYGMNELLSYAADRCEIETFWHRLQHDADRASYALVHDVVVLDYDEISMLGSGPGGCAAPGRTAAGDVNLASRQGGKASLTFLDDAIAACRRPAEEAGVDALVTAPICKESWALAGTKFPGHTELLKQRTRAKRVAMMFHGVEHDPALPGGQAPFRVTLATIHVGLMELRNLLTIGTVFDPIDLTHQALRDLGIASPRIAVSGLNPHASENGRFGDEEYRVITPAIRMAQQAGMDVSGPYPADTLFTPANRRRFDAFVTMYHDQGLIPMKMLCFDNAVNHTLGLPIIRTSVDHGTAFDLVGKDAADPGSMKSAIRLAAQMAERRLAASVASSTRAG